MRRREFIVGLAIGLTIPETLLATAMELVVEDRDFRSKSGPIGLIGRMGAMPGP
jgi:hypothetical protein